jgi:hypothetical protein
MKISLLGAALALSALASVPAHAVLVGFSYTNTNVVGGDQSGRTSPLLPASNAATLGSGVFIETFSAINGGGNAQGCGLDTPSSLATLSGGTYGFRSGSVRGAAPPAGDSTCYAYGPSIGGPLPDQVNINYSGLISTFGNGSGLNYLGLYYGSIDGYNDLIFYNAQNQVIKTVTGASLISEFHGVAGNQSADSSNIYVNLYFTAAEQFTSFSFRTTGLAFEMDNVSVGFNVTPIPEPASIALLGMGLAALGATRRRKTKG